MKAIQTHYDGYRFRSRLEARWALFFNEIGWHYEYEKEGFVLDGGIPYLPDFFLPQLNTWVEVKPTLFSIEEKEKCRLLSKGLGTDDVVMMAIGNPAPVLYNGFVFGEECVGMTLSSYIRSKGWSCPYFGGDWWSYDMEAFYKAKSARFEFLGKN